MQDLRTQFFTRDGVVRAVDGISFDVRRGETVGVVGESGSGKSVTALSVMGLLPRRNARVTGGNIMFEGRDLTALDDAAMRAFRGGELAMIFQEPMTSLNPVLKIGYQLVEALKVHRRLSRMQARRHALAMLELVRLPDPERRLDQYPFELSGGMRQRVMIAMALSCDPKLLIADEATTALDVTVQAQILALVRDLKQRLGMAVIMITHDLGVVAETADRVVVMYAGKVVERAAVKPLFRQPLHPYTRGLLGSIPRLPQPGHDPGEERAPLEELEGFVPSLRDPPGGCRFAPRCSFATSRCRAEEPPLLEVQPGRFTACFHWDALAAAPDVRHG
ncbi:ABC transporter ATP-binding protein [Acuticoccus sp.]|uniref:ABC transporter ATP-binding protein n=1 Tax=Acuticoccus sp. TaxID=1904378 RepID=UPI003B529E4C